METKTATNYSPEESSDNEEADQPVEDEDPNDSVARILKQLKSTGSLIKTLKKEYRCVTCDIDFKDWDAQSKHLIKHVSMPDLILKRVDDDDDDDEEQWSDEEEEPPVQKTPQKIDISQLMNKSGLQIKKPANAEPNAAINKLSGLGFTIKKSTTPNTTPIKQEKDQPGNENLMQKLGQLGGIKLKLKSDGASGNSFKIVNGLKDFKTSDDEGEDSDKGEDDEDQGSEADTTGDKDDADAPNSSKSSENDEPLSNKTIKITKVTPQKTNSNPHQDKSTLEQLLIKPNRPIIKQTPKRINLIQNKPQVVAKVAEVINTTTPAPELETNTQQKESEHVEVKKEVEEQIETISTPLFTDQIKTERSSPPPTAKENPNPVITTVKTETNPDTDKNTQPLFSNENTGMPTPLLPVTKTEGTTVIEINGDSNDEDDDCCVVSSTLPPDVKPVIPKTEATAPVATSTTTYPSQTYLSSDPSKLGFSSTDTSTRSSLFSTEKQHSFNWNAPDTKPTIDFFEKTEDIFENLLSKNTSDSNEYISFDRLGAQHSCDICNLRFTSTSLLEDHIRKTGHSKSVVTPSATLIPYNPTSGMMLSSLLPVKQLAEQVGKLSTINNSSPFTHQQNVMINIQAYPGASGMMAPPPQYGTYPGQNIPSYGNAQAQQMYSQQQQQQMPGQYPNQYGQTGYGQQYPQQTFPNVSQSPYGMPNLTPTSSYSSSQSPLQNMQNLYGQSMNNPQMVPGQMNPGMQQQGHQFVPTSSPGGMRPPTGPPNTSGIKIQSVQTIPSGQLLGANGQPINPGHGTAAASPVRVIAGPSNPQIRPRMPTIVRGARPSIRPGVHVQGGGRQIRPGARMPMKRPGAPLNNQGIKRRPDMLLPGKHDNEDCQVMSMQKQREGMPMIHSVQGAKDKLNLGSQISITKKTVNKEASAMANVLASRGISVKAKQKSRSPTPERPIPHIPNLGAGVSIKHTSKPSKFSIPEAKVGGGMYSCKVCKKMFMNPNSLAVHMTAAHPQSKIPVFKCDECPASYPKSLQLQHHKRVFHNVNGPKRELGLPVVDLSQEDNLEKLSNLGIYSYIPLATRENAPGCFGIPVISVNNMQNGLTTSLQALGADGLLSLGPLKALPN